MVAGAPRTVSFSPDEMIALGKEMIEWVNRMNPIHLSQWYTIHKGFTYNEWKSFIQRKEFVPYYEQALKFVGLNYINGNINPSIAQRFIRVYFKDVKEEEDETAKYLSELKKEEGKSLIQLQQEAMAKDIEQKQQRNPVKE